jgi:hypothetical protein
LTFKIVAKWKKVCVLFLYIAKANTARSPTNSETCTRATASVGADEDPPETPTPDSNGKNLWHRLETHLTYALAIFEKYVPGTRSYALSLIFGTDII